MAEQSQARSELHVDIPNECAHYLLPTRLYLNRRYFTWAFSSPPPFYLSKWFSNNTFIKVFLCIAQEKVGGDSSFSLKSLCTIRQQSVFGTLLLGFQEYRLWASVFWLHICVFWLILPGFTCFYSHAWPFISAFCFGVWFFFFCWVWGFFL